MTAIYSILLTGVKSPAEAPAVAHFTGAGHRVHTAASGLATIDALKESGIQVIYLQAAADNLALGELRRVKEIRPDLPVILILADPSTSFIRDAWHSGATDVLCLPLTPDLLDGSLKRAMKPFQEQRDQEIVGAQARFRYLDDAGKERWISIVPPKFTIGRSSTNDLVLSQMSVSRAHAEVLVQENEYILRDLGSKHGTFLNGSKIEQARLGNGDRVQLGGLQGNHLTFHQGDLLQSLLGSSDAKPDAGLSIKGFREIGMLLATFRALSSIPLLDDLLALVVDTAIELTGAERGFIMLKDEQEDLGFRCARNAYKRPLDGSSFQTSRRVPDEVFKTGQRVVINDLDLGDDSEDHSSTRRLGLRSIFCVPLRYLSFHDAGSMSGIGRMETIGVLYVDSQSIGAGLSNTQLDALETLASEAAMAIYNARLYRESQEKRKMDEELAIAREIQQALLPNPIKTMPFVCGHSLSVPCREVGGDYFDYFDMEGGRLGFALGDVAGKGMAAALLTSMIQGMFCAQTLLDLELPAMISNVNRNLVRRGTGNRFVTFFFGILDSGGHCVYTNAGHNPPFLVSRDGSIEELRDGGMVLGLFAAAQYESRTIQFQPGDHAVLFTDGVLEALNTAGEEFGEERLRALLKEHARASTPEILARLQEAIVAFSANTPQHDDITMMVLGFKE
jgi:serine phosphatase RsbU (regulator of sigma subunit)/pSer/pThr/pTyr-binding forkhead associated (FHA) protein